MNFLFNLLFHKKNIYDKESITLKTIQEIEEIEEKEKIQEIEEIEEKEKIQEIEEIEEKETIQEIEEIEEKEKIQEIEEIEEKEKIQEIEEIEEEETKQEIEEIEEKEKIQEIEEIEEEETIQKIQETIQKIQEEIQEEIEEEIEEEIDGIKKVLNKEFIGELDVNTMLKNSTFKISPEELIKRSKEILKNGIGLNNENDLADNFEFIFPIVGPLNKKEYISTLKKFDLGKMFPNIDKGIYYNFYVDPYEHNRVWFTARIRNIHSGSNFFGPATNIFVDSPPQVNSFTFNEEGQVIKYTGGYITDRTIGNTGGLGGVFGILYAIGRPLPFPEANPYKKSWQFKMFSFFGF